MDRGGSAPPPPPTGRIAALAGSLPQANPTNTQDMQLKAQAEQFRHELEDDLDAYDLAHVEAVERRVATSWLGRFFPSLNPTAHTVDAASLSPPPLAEHLSGSAAEEASAAVTAAAATAAAAAAEKSGGKKTAVSGSERLRSTGSASTGSPCSPQQGQVSAIAAAAAALKDAPRPAVPGAPSLEERMAQSLTRRLMYRTVNPNRVPLLERKIVPLMCAGALALVWTPDHWKLKSLVLCDYYYAMLRRRVHTAYWQATMDPEDFIVLMEQMEANLPKHLRTVQSSDCPL